MKNTMVRFIDCHVPTETCNFRCPYCYITQKRSFEKKLDRIERTPEEVRKALSMKRWGGILFINFCAGGETLLGDDLLPIILEVLKEGHFVQIVTNGSISKQFDQISKWPAELLERLFFKFSFHYTELKRQNLVEIFFRNILKVKNAGASISIEITPGDDMIPYINDMKEECIKYLGALPHVTVARNERTSDFEILTSYTEKKYRDFWGQFNSPMFELKMRLLSEKRTEFCYAGEWTFFLNLKSGDLKQCYRGALIDNIYCDINQPIHFKPIGRHCPESYCYNGHVWMTLGVIPNIDVPSYSDMRDRECMDGKRWLSDTVRDFFSQKFATNNTIYDEDCGMKRVLLLGDSICEGYTPYVKERFAERVIVYRPKEVGRFTTYMLRYIAEWARNMRIGSNIDVVHFNVGLWDILRIYGDEPLVSLDDYTRNLKRIIQRIRYVFPNAKLVFATITPILEGESGYFLLRQNADVELYNKKAEEIMNENAIEINDLYVLAKGFAEDLYLDMVHFTEEGYRYLAEQVSRYIERNLMVE